MMETLTDGWGRVFQTPYPQRRAQSETRRHVEKSSSRKPTMRTRRHKVDLRIGLCPSCGRRYGFVLEDGETVPSADQWEPVSRLCDRHKGAP